MKFKDYERRIKFDPLKELIERFRYHHNFEPEEVVIFYSEQIRSKIQAIGIYDRKSKEQWFLDASLWLQTNCQGGYHEFTQGIWFFEKTSDAVMFKLVFG